MPDEELHRGEPAGVEGEAGGIGQTSGDECAALGGSKKDEGDDVFLFAFAAQLIRSISL
jgi:hypothetical protein